MKKKIIALLSVLIAVLMLFGACAVEETQDTAAAGSPPETTDNPVVVEVDGEPIYYDQYHTYYASVCAQYGIEEDDEANGAYIRDMIIDSLVNEKIMMQKLTENGYMDLTDKQIAQAEQDSQAYLDSIVEAYYGATIESALEEGYTDAQYEEAKVPYEEQVLTEMGYTKEEYLNYYKMTIAGDMAREALVGDITPTEEEIQAKYDENVAYDQEAMEEDPTQYVSTALTGSTVYYVPAGIRMVRQVLIKIDEDSSGAISVLREQGYGDQADYLLEKALADIKPEADDVISKLDSGSITFDEAVTSLNRDTEMPKDGYAVVEGCMSYVESFTTSAMALDNIGEYTELVSSDYGYHIIEYYSDVSEGAVSYDSVKDEIKESITATMQDEAWQKIIDEWTESYDVVRYEENM